MGEGVGGLSEEGGSHRAGHTHRPRVTVPPAATWSAETLKWERLNEPCECWLALLIPRPIHHRVVSPVPANDALKQGAPAHPWPGALCHTLPPLTSPIPIVQRRDQSFSHACFLRFPLQRKGHGTTRITHVPLEMLKTPVAALSKRCRLRR